MNIRIAKAKDLQELLEIYNQAIAIGGKTADTSFVTKENRQAWFDAHPSHKYPIIVAQIDNKIVGYLSISAYRAGREALQHTAEISYYVHSNYHRKKVATNLIIHVIKMCDKLQFNNLFAIIIEGNLASIKLMEKFGFVKWGKLPKVVNLSGTLFDHLYYGLNIKT